MAFGIDDAIAGVSKLLDDGLNKIFPDPAQKATAEALLLKANNDAAVALMQQQMSVMLAEANSKDPWTSRARPSFMYVMYVLILFAIPMGIVSAFRPDMAVSVAQGMKAWLAAIPDGLWTTFGIGYAGYSVSRSWEKKKGLAK
jgi:hypothetical protein